MVHEVQLPGGPTIGFPITYMMGGQRYIVVAALDEENIAELVAFTVHQAMSLPKPLERSPRYGSGLVLARSRSTDAFLSVVFPSPFRHSHRRTDS